MIRNTFAATASLALTFLLVVGSGAQGSSLFG